MPEGPDPLLDAVAAHGLTTRLRPPPGPLDPHTWGALVARARLERMVGHLHAAVVDGALAVGGDQRDQIAELHRQRSLACLRLEHLLLDVVAALDAGGVDHRLMKGPALAHGAYPDPSQRLFHDIDLLVPGDSIDQALACLGAIGVRRRSPEPSPGFDRRFAKGITMLTAEGLEVDLHRTLASGPFAFTIALEDLWRAPAEVVVAGRPMRTLSADAQVLAACLEVAVGDVPPRLSSMRDLAQLLLAGRHRPEAVLEMADRSRARAAVADAATTTWDRLGLTVADPLVDWARAHTPTPEEAGLLSAARRRDGGFAGEALRSLPYIPGAARKISFLRSVLLPSAAFLAEEGETRRSWLARGARRIVARGERR